MLKVYTPSLEDIVISKLASPRPKDDIDIHSPAILAKVDLSLLDTIVSSGVMQDGFLSDRARRDFQIDYDNFVADVRRFRDGS